MSQPKYQYLYDSSQKQKENKNIKICTPETVCFMSDAEKDQHLLYLYRVLKNTSAEHIKKPIQDTLNVLFPLSKEHDYIFYYLMNLVMLDQINDGKLKSEKVKLETENNMLESNHHTSEDKELFKFAKEIKSLPRVQQHVLLEDKINEMKTHKQQNAGSHSIVEQANKSVPSQSKLSHLFSCCMKSEKAEESEVLIKKPK